MKPKTMTDNLPESPPGHGMPVVGIGASAGGIEALQSFFDALPEAPGAAFVVIVHLSPEHHSELSGVLQRHTAMPVAEVQDSLPLEVDHVYVIPPDRQLTITDGKVSAKPFEQPRGHRAPVDLFFRSMAAAFGDGFAVILSGGGPDGAVGARTVSDCGGVVLVQDPEEASFDPMPRAAITGGAADFVLPVSELAALLARLIVQRGRLARSMASGAPAEEEQQVTVNRIVTLLNTRLGHDFSHYKPATVLRRIARRMQIQHRESLEDYLAFLRENAQEVQTLFAELLISVTSFFRDPEAWDALAEKVIGPLLEEHQGDEPLRVWVPGSATGEEAYSIAILAAEEAERRGQRANVQVFASDLDEGALASAREGRYPAAIAADVSDTRLRRYFIHHEDSYQVTGPIRDMVTFASHSLLRDPPFSRLDLVSCRNLLIYLDREVQQKVFGLLHYALRPGGYLFLGVSESADEEYFRPVDRRLRIFQSREVSGRVPSLMPEFSSGGLRASLLPHRFADLRGGQGPGRVHRELLEELAPPSMLVDEHRKVLHLSETAGRFLQHSGGPLSQDATTLVRPELQLELSARLQGAIDKGEAGLSPFIPVQFDGSPRRVAVLVQPRQGPKNLDRLALVVFLDGGTVDAAAARPASGEDGPITVQDLREELRVAQQRVTTVREDYETANEELRAANEELQSVNEEYRSTAEELETSKEELQSMNEEFRTINGQLTAKLDEVARAHADLENLMAATEGGTLFLDRELRIKRFTPQVTHLFRIKDSDLERRITDLTHDLHYDALESDALRVLGDLIPIEREVFRSTGQWYLVRFRPYRTLDHRIDGVVVTFVEITAQKEAEDILREADANKNHFLAVLGHELRNPLAAVSGALAVLKMREELPNRVNSSLAVIEQQMHHLVRLVDDLLNLSRINRGDVEVRSAPMDLMDSIGIAVEQARSEVDLGRHHLDQDGVKGPLPVLGDRERLTQVIANLLVNAARYTQPGGTITLSGAGEGDTVTVRVRDNGNGLSPDQLARLFKPFERAGGASQTHPTGLGLGLALAHHLVELQGGTLEASSEGPGQGSEFLLRLPAFREAQQSSSQPSAPAKPGTDLPRRRILLVEDHPLVGAVTRALLEELGQEVQLVTRGAEVLEAVRAFRPDLVFLDIGLPDMSGLEVLRELRRTLGDECPGLVGLSGYGPDQMSPESLAELDGYLIKPAQPEDVLRVLEEN